MEKTTTILFLVIRRTNASFSQRTVSHLEASWARKGGVFWNTGDEHDEYGHITEDPVVRVRMMDKRMKKLETV